MFVDSPTISLLSTLKCKHLFFPQTWGGAEAGYALDQCCASKPNEVKILLFDQASP